MGVVCNFDKHRYNLLAHAAEVVRKSRNLDHRNLDQPLRESGQTNS